MIHQLGNFKILHAYIMVGWGGMMIGIPSFHTGLVLKRNPTVIIALQKMKYQMHLLGLYSRNAANKLLTSIGSNLFKKIFFFVFVLKLIGKKRLINQYLKSISLNPTDCRYKYLQWLSSSGSIFISSNLHLTGEKRKTAKETALAFFKKSSRGF